MASIINVDKIQNAAASISVDTYVASGPAKSRASWANSRIAIFQMRTISMYHLEQITASQIFTISSTYTSSLIVLLNTL